MCDSLLSALCPLLELFFSFFHVFIKDPPPTTTEAALGVAAVNRTRESQKPCCNFFFSIFYVLLSHALCCCRLAPLWQWNVFLMLLKSDTFQQHKIDLYLQPLTATTPRFSFFFWTVESSSRCHICTLLLLKPTSANNSLCTSSLFGSFIFDEVHSASVTSSFGNFDNTLNAPIKSLFAE